MNRPEHAGIVIVGGGQAGGWAAKTLRDRGYSGRLTVVSDEPYDFYERPPLSKAALLDAAAPLSRLFSEQTVAELNIDWRRPLRAESIDAEQQIVTLSDGQRLQFEQLLIATGGRPRLPGAAWAQHPRVMTLRSWDDAARLRQGLQGCRRLAIVGGGWIGLEIAASARRLGAEVTVFERQPALCMRSVGADVSQALLELHRQQGVTVLCGCGEISLEDRDGAACAMLDAFAAPYDDVAWLWSDQYDANIQILGVPSGGVHHVVRRTPQSQVFFTLNADRQLVQMVAFNDARTIKLGKRWLASGRVLDPQQLADAEFSLMALK
ncbi:MULTISPECIES: FAD-dependent oxidoreductase [unclassified Serratia (in: enterobacteria)]|uniref:NAD(P)/FAD-dependent oxidoreductase n=1 Tax=unclassified Serratia (in: enterobacteria) TaxID=2647522 RepID=UPI0027E95D43|nr:MULTISPECIES: FAD-dependent oxidoreductase [unclassified Serratia (in: enterobacteria)]MDQ7099698.1 FAD-dependent oxidoreductase [Serratia sp. MF2]MDQ7104774.1 FAD-dependent oxidoreductase [Serratia sp. MF1(2023)]